MWRFIYVNRAYFFDKLRKSVPNGTLFLCMGAARHSFLRGLFRRLRFWMEYAIMDLFQRFEVWI